MIQRLRLIYRSRMFAPGCTGVWAIKTYMPHTGKEAELENVLKTHWESLKAAGLVSRRLGHGRKT